MKLRGQRTFFTVAQVPTLVSSRMVECGLKLSQTMAILVTAEYSERRYRQNSRNRAQVFLRLGVPGVPQLRGALAGERAV